MKITYITPCATLLSNLTPNPFPTSVGYGVNTSRITPLNPPLERGEKEI
jgi:NCAIR mutase (PurE)-related protein